MRELKFWMMRENSAQDIQTSAEILSSASSLSHNPSGPSIKGIENGEEDLVQAIERHITVHIGKAETVLRDSYSNRVRIDIYVISPSDEYPHITLVTSGMSSLPMAAPPDLREFRYAELILCLPFDWSLERSAFEDEAVYWPVRWLKILARFPHLYNTWVWSGHTVPNGSPPKPYAVNTNLCCLLLSTPTMFNENFRELRIHQDKTIYFHSVIPIYQKEMEYKLRKGYDALIKKLKDAEVNELLNRERENTIRRWWQR